MCLIACVAVPLFDVESMYRNWTALLRHVWRRAALEQLPPVQIDVNTLAEAHDVDSTWGDFSFRP